MATVQIDTDHIDAVRDAVVRGLTAYNDRFLPEARDRVPFVASVRDDDGRVVGGIIGEMRMDWLYIDLLWIDEGQRGRGHGEKLMRMAEDSARAAGKTHIHLWTWSFQAPEFYARLGYREFGRLTDHPKGHDTIMLSKTL